MQMTITKIIADGQDCTVFFNLTPVPATTYVTAVGGDTVDFTKATQDPAFVGPAAVIPSSLAPVSFDVWDVSGNLANGYFPVLGSLQTNCKLKITSAFNTELGSGAYPATIQLQGTAVFRKQI